MPDPSGLTDQFRDAFGRNLVLLKARAVHDPWDGRSAITSRHRMYFKHPSEEDRVFSVILTYDSGSHNCGWWANSDYDTCYHLSFVAMYVSPLNVQNVRFETPTDSEVEALGNVAFGKDISRCWREPPASAFDAYRSAPQSRHTWHIRLFVDKLTGEPILPEGEVYNLKPWPDGSSPEKAYH